MKTVPNKKVTPIINVVQKVSMGTQCVDQVNAMVQTTNDVLFSGDKDQTLAVTQVLTTQSHTLTPKNEGPNDENEG